MKLTLGNERCLKGAAFATLVLALALFYPSTVVAESFEFTFNNVSGKSPVGLVRITLMTDGDPSGATLKLTRGTDPAESLTLPGFLDHSSGAQIEAGAVDSNVVVFFESKHLLETPSPPNYCVAKVLPADPWTLELTGTTATVEEIRVSAFASVFSDEEAYCDCSGRRIADERFSYTVPTGVTVDRQGMDVALVLDQSGSMGTSVDGVPKIDYLEWAIGQFIDTWETDSVSDDRLALVTFESVFHEPLGGTFFPRGTAPDPWQDVEDAVIALTDGGYTALGQGLQRAIDIWDPAGPVLSKSPDLHVVLLTNGRQNVDPEVEYDVADNAVLCPEAASDPASCDGSSLIPLREYCGVTVHTIGIDLSGPDENALLANLATQTGGSFHKEENPAAMDDDFINALLNSMKGNTLSLLARRRGDLPTGSSPALPLPFEVDGSVEKVVALLSWRGPEDGLALDLTYGTTALTPVATQDDTPFYVLHTFEPSGSLPTTWQATVRPVDPLTQPVTYTLTLLAVESDFAYRAKLAGTPYFAGDPIVLQVTANEGGQPRTDLAGAITVTPSGPPTALGSFLRDNPVGPEVLDKNPDGVHEDQTPTRWARKLYELAKTTNLRQLVSPKPAESLTMVDDGDSEQGDEQEGDGIYSRAFRHTQIPGHYELALEIRAGGVVRRELIEIEVRVGRADPDESEIDVAAGTAVGELQLTVIPADSFGNFFGPSYEDTIEVEVEGLGVVDVTPEDELADGTYVMTLTGIDEQANPTLTVRVEDVVIAECPIKSCGRVKKPFAVFAGYGRTEPQGLLDDFFSGAESYHLGFEYRPRNRLSIEAVLGHDEFDPEGDSPNAELDRLAVNVKIYPRIGTWQYAFFGGPEGFDIDGGSTFGGFNLGWIGERRLTTNWSLELTLTQHWITSGRTLRYATGIFGVRRRF